VILLGITGGIGMGKSTSADHLAALGIPVVDTDRIARDVVQPGLPALAQIVAVFGRHILDDTGTLDRARLAEVVFSEPGARTQLEAILHPRIREEWRRQVSAWRGAGHPAAAVVIPLLFETDASSDFDEIACIACSESTQKQRLLDRGWTDQHLRGRLAAQWPIAEKIRRSSVVIWTEPPIEIHRRQLHRMLSDLGITPTSA
jgi:dephospho-CoA kinase